MKRFQFYVLICTIFTAGFSQLCLAGTEEFPRGVAWKQIRTRHFVIIFAKQHNRAAQRIAYLVEAVQADMFRFFDYDGENTLKTNVILTDQSDIVDLYNTFLPGKKNTIILNLKRPYAGNFPTLDVYSQDWLAQQFIYQYTTVLHHKMDGFFRKSLGTPFPDDGFSGWMDRGMGVYLERILYEEDGRSSYFDMLMRTEVLEGRLTSLSQRAAIGLRDWPGDIGMFLYGYAFLDYLTETYGIDRLVQLNRQHNERIPVFGGDAFKATYTKSLKILQEEWLVTLQRRYRTQIQEIQSQPLTSSTPISTSGQFTNSPVFSPEGDYIYYIEAIPGETPKLIRMHLRDQHRETLVTGYFSGDFSLSAHGGYLCFCKVERYKGYYDFSDLYLLDLETLKVTRLTTGERVVDPVLTSNGEAVIYTTTEVDTMKLMRMELSSGHRTTLLKMNTYTQIRHPALSSDDTQLAVQLWKQGGCEDIYVMNSDGSHLRPITQDQAMDTSPAWGLDDGYLFFSSDRTGVPNIFAYSLKDQTLYQVTNVLTGVFDPAVSPDEQHLAVEQYSGDGMNIHLVNLSGHEWKMIGGSAQEQPTTSGKYAGISEHDVSGYNPFPSLMPGPMPALGEDEEGFQLGLTVTGKDILEHHEYSASVLYGLESQNISFDIEYINRQFYPTIRLFGYDMPKKYTNLFQNDQGEDEEYFERQQGFGGDVVAPFYRTRHTTLSLLTGYDYRKLSHLTDFDTLRDPLPDEGILSSVSSGILFDRIGAYRYPNEKPRQILLLKYARYDKSFGSDFDINEFTGELDMRVKVPFLRRHLLRLRVAGGLSEGDILEQGVFQLGGYLFNTPSDILEGPQFFLRGYEENAFAGDRAVVGTAEYQFPFWSPQRTIWGGRIFCDSFTGTFFYETGDAWKDNWRDLDLKHSIGVELSLNIGVNYGKLPLSLGIGFARGLDENIGESTQVYFSFGMGD